MALRTVVITISDSRSAGTAADLGGPAVIAALPALGAELTHRQLVPDEIDAIRGAVSAWIGRCDLILTTGGTGIAPRDITPEAIEPLLERRLPGFGEIMRARGYERKPASILSRGGAGVATGTLIVMLPGSPRGAADCVSWLAQAIRHGCEQIRGSASHRADDGA